MQLQRLMERQHAIANREQLARVGVTASRLRAEIEGGRRRAINEKVICLHNGPLTRRQQLWAVLLSAPPTAALAGLTVLELHRLRGFTTAAVDVLVPHGRRVLTVPGVDIHVHPVRRFPAEDIRLFDDLRTTLPSRAVVDAASWTQDQMSAARLLVAGVQQLRIQPSVLTAEILARRTSRHRRLLLLLANDLEGGAQAVSEVEF